MEAQDPTIVMLDQLMRVLLTETIRAAVWALVFAAVYRWIRK